MKDTSEFKALTPHYCAFWYLQILFNQSDPAWLEGNVPFLAGNINKIKYYFDIFQSVLLSSDAIFNTTGIDPLAASRLSLARLCLGLAFINETTSLKERDAALEGLASFLFSTDAIPFSKRNSEEFFECVIQLKIQLFKRKIIRTIKEFKSYPKDIFNEKRLETLENFFVHLNRLDVEQKLEKSYPDDQWIVHFFDFLKPLVSTFNSLNPPLPEGTEKAQHITKTPSRNSSHSPRGIEEISLKKSSRGASKHSEDKIGEFSHIQSKRTRLNTPRTAEPSTMSQSPLKSPIKTNSKGVERKGKDFNKRDSTAVKITSGDELKESKKLRKSKKIIIRTLSDNNKGADNYISAPKQFSSPPKTKKIRKVSETDDEKDEKEKDFEKVSAPQVMDRHDSDSDEFVKAYEARSKLKRKSKSS